jgi:hypothetical protein
MLYTQVESTVPGIAERPGFLLNENKIKNVCIRVLYLGTVHVIILDLVIGYIFNMHN